MHVDRLLNGLKLQPGASIVGTEGTMSVTDFFPRHEFER